MLCNTCINQGADLIYTSHFNRISAASNVIKSRKTRCLSFTGRSKRKIFNFPQPDIGQTLRNLRWMNILRDEAKTLAVNEPRRQKLQICHYISQICSHEGLKRKNAAIIQRCQYIHMQIFVIFGGSGDSIEIKENPTCDFWSASSLKKELLSVELLLKNLVKLAHFKRLIPKRNNDIFGQIRRSRDREQNGRRNKNCIAQRKLVTSHEFQWWKIRNGNAGNQGSVARVIRAE